MTAKRSTMLQASPVHSGNNRRPG
ncbi:MAG: DUF3037 domain-containing protein [Taibaiella sp.]|nr:DUF3037 domain-containing protein [Taibaiella sp.]